MTPAQDEQLFHPATALPLAERETLGAIDILLVIADARQAEFGEDLVVHESKVVLLARTLDHFASDAAVGS